MTTRLAILATAALLCGCGPAPAPPATPTVGPGLHFEEVAEKAGLKWRMNFLRPEQGENFRINLYDHGTGVCVADVDGDGKDDILLLNELGSNGLFRNKGDGTFEDVTAASGVAMDDRICVGGAFGDADGDGDADLYVTTTRAGNAYFENDGKGRFRDATTEAGLALVAHSETPAWFDADGDGDLDLLVTNTAKWTLDSFNENLKYYRGKATLAELIDSEREYNVFFRNEGKGKFTDATAGSGLRGRGWAGDVAIFDIEDDGDPDVFVCNMFGASALYRNDGKGKFEDATKEVLGATSWGAVGARAFDYDGDGRLDLFVADMHSDMWIPFTLDPALVEEKKKYRSFFDRGIQIGVATEQQDREFELKVGLDRSEVLFGNTLFRNLGGGKFEETSDRANAETFWPWGVVDADYDGDGFVDAFLPSGMGSPLFYWPSPLLRNRGDGTFEEVGRKAGTEPPPGGPKSPTEIYNGAPATRAARAGATLDFDGDGRMDFVVMTWNDRALLYRNTAAPGNWCGFRLVGRAPNRDAIGAVVRLTAGGRTQVRQVAAGGGYLSQSTNAVHFGLGAATAADRVEIRWPDGTKQTVEKPALGAWTTVTEPAR